MNKENTCPVGERLHAEYLLDGYCSHCKTSAPDWREEFNKWWWDCKSKFGFVDPLAVEELIAKEKAQSYQQGRMEMAEEILKFVEDEAGKTGRREIINFINNLKLN